MYHGTHVAGTIAAQDNGLGVVGVAPQVSLHIVRGLDSTNTLVSSLITSMKACADADANIISMSLGGPLVSPVQTPDHSRCSIILPTNIPLHSLRCSIPVLRARSYEAYTSREFY